jgi:hypothetical protein
METKREEAGDASLGGLGIAKVEILAKLPPQRHSGRCPPWQSTTCTSNRSGEAKAIHVRGEDSCRIPASVRFWPLWLSAYIASGWANRIPTVALSSDACVLRFSYP